MKATSTLWGGLLVLIVLIAGCRPDASPTNSAPPQLGWGDTEVSLSVVNGTAQLTAFLTRPVRQELSIPLAISGTAIPGQDYTLPGGDVLIFAAGTSEASITFQTDSNPDEDRITKMLTVEIPTSEDYRLAEDRAVATLTFGLNNTVNLELWADGTSFPQLWGYTTFGPDPVPPTGRTGQFFAFAYQSNTMENTIGFLGDRPEVSTNVLNIVRIYDDLSAFSMGVRLPNLLKFTPAEEGATAGTVEVIPQDVFIQRISSSDLPDFTIGLSGSGTYDETTGIILLDVHFDETDIGGPADTLRRYSLEASQRN
ncbi:hypothetical protein [Lewinella sp. W8]|uniref:hypothetical protein n=1 Tax=Lewinella sp. W8 TaxID=2528208 RepID=UPI001067B76C|nr:hypothetical protein [Lewinella sp. W8]MTB51438.1 hypothetical protein [Lewinella sp. W8]